MKKLFLMLGCLVLITACQSAPVESSTPTTVIPTPSALPATTTATAIPSTPVPYFFTEEFNGDLGAWVSFQTGGAEAPAVSLENDTLSINFPSPNTWYYAIHNAHEYSNVFVNAKFSGTPTGSLGVICDYSESKGWYEFNLASDGTYNILFGQWLAEGIAQYTPITNKPTEYLKPEKLDYEIGLTCQDNILLLHINGKLFHKLDVTRYGLTKGMIGITASSFDEVPMTATFDWIKVSEPSQ